MNSFPEEEVREECGWGNHGWSQEEFAPSATPQLNLGMNPSLLTLTGLVPPFLFSHCSERIQRSAVEAEDSFRIPNYVRSLILSCKFIMSGSIVGDEEATRLLEKVEQGPCTFSEL